MKSRITAQTVKFSMKDFFSKFDQIRRKPRIWPHLLKDFLMKNFIFWTVDVAVIFLYSSICLYRDCLRDTINLEKTKFKFRMSLYVGMVMNVIEYYIKSNSS